MTTYSVVVTTPARVTVQGHAPTQQKQYGIVSDPILIRAFMKVPSISHVSPSTTGIDISAKVSVVMPDIEYEDGTWASAVAPPSVVSVLMPTPQVRAIPNSAVGVRLWNGDQWVFATGEIWDGTAWVPFDDSALEAYKPPWL